MHRFNAEDTAKWTETPLGRQVEGLLNGLVLSKSPKERRVYLSICEKQLHSRVYKVRSRATF